MSKRKVVGTCKHCGSKYAFYKGSKYCSDNCQFFSRVEKTDGCWLWTGSVGSHGYGQINVRGELRTTHRHSALIHKGVAIKDPVFVMHTCDNRRCVNPDHLAVGNSALNQLDMAIKRRGIIKFSVQQAAYIRRELSNGRSALSLSKEMSCSQPTILAVKYRRWIGYR